MPRNYRRRRSIKPYLHSGRKLNRYLPFHVFYGKWQLAGRRELTVMTLNRVSSLYV